MATLAMSKIREYRQSIGLSQEAFALALNVRKATISRIETGKRTPSVGLITRICEFSAGALTANDLIAVNLAPSDEPVTEREPTE
jgi:transcriptional regulator with XRE-family HTH domain